MNKYKEKIRKLINSIVPEAELRVEEPPDPNLGDISIPCFSLAGKTGKNPVETALYIKDKIEKPGFIDRIETKGPYLNFFLDLGQQQGKLILDFCYYNCL